MTMSSAVSKVTLNGDGVQTSWPFSFKVWKAGDLEVILTSPGGTESVTTDWSVVLAGSGGTLTYPVLGYPLLTGWKITIRRSMDFLQEVDLVSGTRWDPEVVETALDQAAAERQQLLEEIGRSVRIGVASTEDPTQVVNQVFLARDQAAASAGAAATSESNAADSAAAAQLAASHIGVLGAEGTLTTGQDTITLPFAYDFEKEAIAVYLGGIRQNKASLTFPDAYTVVLDTPVATNTEYIVSSVTLEGEAILTGLRDDAVAAKDGAETAQGLAEDARDAALAAVVPATETAAGVVELATTAEAAADDTSRAVTGAGVTAAINAKLNVSGDAPMGACRAWANFDGTQSSIVPRSSLNVSSVAKNGTGDYTINFATAMPDANYSVSGSCRSPSDGSSNTVFQVSSQAAISASSVRIRSLFPGTGYPDSDTVSVAIFR